MPSMVLLIRSRLRIRPRSFSMRMPSRSAYWRLILRRPASSLGRSASSSGSSPISPKLAYRSRLEVLLLRALPICVPPVRSAGAADVTARLLADQEEALASVSGKQGHLAIGAAARAYVLVLHVAGLLSSLCFLFRHDWKR